MYGWHVHVRSLFIFFSILPTAIYHDYSPLIYDTTAKFNDKNIMTRDSRNLNLTIRPRNEMYMANQGRG